LKCVIRDDSLPLSFINIFDNVTDLFNYVSETAVENLDIVDSTLKIFVKTVRLREVNIELIRS
jgi:hypothetical protein